MEVDRNGLEVLERQECLRLLASATLGRIGVTSGALPAAVLPVNFSFDQDRILILTDERSKLDAAARNAVVAFEVDDFDPLYHSGWSVVVTGVASEVTDPSELAALRSGPLTRWAPRADGRLVAIATDRISGRRIVAGQPPTTGDAPMRMVNARTGIEWLDRDECLRLLAADEVGRLGVVAGGAPVIFPVNYRLDGDAIVFRTDPGTKLDHGPRSPACFEIDHLDRQHRRGWSVVVAGRLEEVTIYDAATLERVRRLPVDPWAGGEKAHWMRLVPSRITGRRVGTELTPMVPGRTGPAALGEDGAG